MPNTFMAVAMDTFDVKISDWQGGIHPMNKQTPAQRLAYAGFNVAYGYTKYPTGGPFPKSVNYESKTEMPNSKLIKRT